VLHGGQSTSGRAYTFTRHALKLAILSHSQLEILNDHHRTPLLAGRFTGSYRYRCADRRCRGHRQNLPDGLEVERRSPRPHATAGADRT